MGTVEIAREDPELLTADEAIRALMGRSVARTARAIGRASRPGSGRTRGAKARA